AGRTRRDLVARTALRTAHATGRCRAPHGALAPGGGALARLDEKSMNPGRRRLLYGAVAVVATGIGVHAWLSRNVLHFLDGDTAPFVALFPPPPARGSPQERAELDLLLALQRGRTAQQVEFAQADRKT